MKKTLFVLLCIFICAGTVSCSNDSTIAVVDTKGNISYGDTGGLNLPLDINSTSISILVSSDYENLSDKLVIKELSARTGININIISVPPSSIQEKARVLINSNEMPDIMQSSMSFDEVNMLGMQGTFVALNKYINELPNFKKIFVDNSEYNTIFDTFTAEDNNLYIFPKYEFNRIVNHGFLYRKDVFDKHGIQPWKNMEEFYYALKKLKEVYPLSTPYVSKTKTEIFSQWSASFGVNFPGMFYDYEQNKWLYSSTDYRTKEMLDFMKKLYNEKLIDEEFLTTSQTSWESKMITNDRAFVTFDWISRMDIFYEKVKDKNPDYDLSIGEPVGPTGQFVTLPKVGGGPSITNNSKKILSLKLLDYLLSPSGSELMTLGIKNKTYTYDENNMAKYNQFGMDKKVGINDLEEKYGMFIQGLYRTVDKKSIYFNYSKKEQEAVDMANQPGRMAPEIPIVKFTKQEKIEIQEIQNQIKQRSFNFASDYVLSSKSGDLHWEEWLQQAEKYGSKRIEEIYNTAYARQNQQP